MQILNLTNLKQWGRCVLPPAEADALAVVAAEDTADAAAAAGVKPVWRGE